METSEQTEERAAAWLAKRDTGSWTEEDQRQLDEWLQASTANEVAFIRLESVWQQALRMKALAAGTPPSEVPPPDAWNHSPFFDARSVAVAAETAADERPAPLRERSWLSRAIAATVLLAAGSVAWYLQPAGPTYRTVVGGIASVPLQDGSNITLNTDSEIRLAVTDKERRVDLEHGEAFFEVAKDPARPFIVNAGGKRVVAVGTQFSVRRVDNDIRVFVTEGKVRVDAATSAREGSAERTANVPAVSGSSGNGPQMLVAAGSIARTGDEGVLVQDQQLSRIEDYLSWRTGYLVFREITLAEAVAEFNRYNDRKIVIRDPGLATLRLSGKFKATRYEAFVRLLEEGLSIQARAEADRIVLSDGRMPQ